MISVDHCEERVWLWTGVWWLQLAPNNCSILFMNTILLKVPSTCKLTRVQRAINVFIFHHILLQMPYTTLALQKWVICKMPILFSQYGGGWGDSNTSMQKNPEDNWEGAEFRTNSYSNPESREALLGEAEIIDVSRNPKVVNPMQKQQPRC